MTSKRQLHLNVNALNSGFYASAWRAPVSDPHAFADVQHYVKIAKIAERGTFDAIFLADTLSITDKVDHRPTLVLEPTIVLATIAAATTHIGLIATASTSYNEPYNIARRFLTLDRASGGRVGWNIVTSADLATARNFGLTTTPPHSTRYARAAEFTEVVRKLWDSWEGDAVVGDKESALFADTAKIHSISHKGDFYDVAGPLSVPRSPQGQPVLVQAGASDEGRDFAASVAEAVFTVAQTIDEATDYARDLRSRVRSKGRSDDSVVILPGLAFVLGGTEAEAKRRQEEHLDRIPHEYSLPRLAAILQIDQERLKLDELLPDDLEVPSSGASQSFFKATVGLARREKLTVRQLNRRLAGGAGHRVIVGTPEQVAADMEHWLTSGAADGFNLMPDVLPSGLETFVDEVVPLLRKRGIFRSEYTSKTLRGHFGLKEPKNRFGSSR